MNNKEKYWLVKQALFFGIQGPDPNRKVPKRDCWTSGGDEYCESQSAYKKKVKEIRERGEDTLFTTKKRDHWWQYVNPFTANAPQFMVYGGGIVAPLAIALAKSMKKPIEDYDYLHQES